MQGETKKELKIPIIQGIINRIGIKYSFPTYTSSVKHYVIASLVIFITSAICYPFANYIGYQSISLILYFVVSILATMMGIGPILLTSTLSALIWNYFFIPPHFTFHIGKPEDVLMFGMFFFIALINGVLTSRVRRQERLTRDREERTNALFQLTKKLASSSGIDNIVKIAIQNIEKYFSLETTIFLQDGNNKLKKNAENKQVHISPKEFETALWVFNNSRKAGKYTDINPSIDYTFYPLSGTSMKPGVLGVKLKEPFNPDQRIFWNTFQTQISNAIEREFLNELARKALFLDESDKLYKTLFNSISHELRIPVATIMGASELLITSKQSENAKDELNTEIFKASLRLNRLIENLLNMSRLETGRISPKLDWCDVHDIVNHVVNSLSEELKPFTVRIEIPDDIPLIKLDFGLMEQALYNLIYNASQYAKQFTNIRIKVYYEGGWLYIQIMDRGPGFPFDALPFVFKKFYRATGSKPGGTGLGLSIVKGFVDAHKGKIAVENRKNGGACITIKIPSEIPEIKNIL